MLNFCSKKNGFTMVEALVVVTIMGILSSIGVASLRGAVINGKMKDHAINTTAFLERIANEANRLSGPLCVKKYTDQILAVYETDDCSNPPEQFFDSYIIDAPAKFGCGDGFATGQDLHGKEWSSEGDVFEPHVGLSAAPAEGFLCVQYGDEPIYGVAVKAKDKNMIIPMMNLNGVWSRL